MGFVMGTLRSNGITLAYEVEGAGDPLLLISGLGYGGWIWRRVAQLLAGGFRVITFDNRGAGGSDKPEGPYSTAQMGHDAGGLLDGLGVESAYVVGHSLGGFVAQELALARPEVVKRLVLASTTYGGNEVIPITGEALSVMTDRSGDATTLARRGIAIATAPGWAEEHPATTQELVDYRLTSPVPPTAYSAQLMAGATHDAGARIHQIQCPTLVLTGDCDRVVPPGNAELIAKRIGRAQVKMLPNVGHMVPVEAPEALANALRTFLGK